MSNRSAARRLPRIPRPGRRHRGAERERPQSETTDHQQASKRSKRSLDATKWNRGSLSESVVRQTSAERNLALKLVQVKDHAEGLAKMDSGEVAAVANDDALLFGLASKAKDPSQYDFVGKYLSVEPYGIMYRKDDPGFTRLMDNVIGGLFASGEIRAIHAKWFESGAFRLPMSQYMKENIKLPNKYGVP
ncbi:MAG: transporter substrate-binding domain-containing protein [Burkholderiales bacterium]|nr:transporter substrate-binding domain-containing protein [Burkholderiales bacterium]